MDRLRERISRKIAWLLPSRIAMWAFYRVAANATQGEWGNECPDQVDVMTAAGRWNAKNPHLLT